MSSKLIGKAHPQRKSSAKAYGRYPHALRASVWYWLLQAIIYFAFAIYMLNFVSQETARQPWAVALVDFMVQWVPMLDQIKKVPGYHPFLLFHYAVLWAALPILAIGMTCVARFSAETRSNTAYRSTQPLMPILAVFLIMTIGVGIFLVWPAHDGSYSRRDLSVVQNGFGVGFFGLMILWVQTIWFAGLFLVCERVYFYVFPIRR